MKKIRAGRENSALAEGAQIRAFHRKSPFGAFGMGHAQGPRPDIVFPAYVGMILERTSKNGKSKHHRLQMGQGLGVVQRR